MMNEEITKKMDEHARALLADAFSSLSPAAALLSTADWLTHLAVSPGKRLELAQLALQQARQLGEYAQRCATAGQGTQPPSCIEPPILDRRFASPLWQAWPYNVAHQAFLLQQQWWEHATHGVLGVEKHHEDLVSFGVRQWLDMLSPGNLPWANPEILERTREDLGANFERGATYWQDDFRRLIQGLPAAGTEAFRVGHEVAATPGKVVLRTPLMELIQYAPDTATVHPEPILLVPAWIMKYYILDLSPSNSLVRYLVGQGHTVFCISWKNPGPAEHDMAMDDYLRDGFFAAMDAIQTICPKRKVHATGYCLGGTLLAIAAAAMARDGDTRLATTTYFAAQTDFSEPGELGLFIDESQLTLLEAQMRERGYLSAGQMAGAFSMLRSNDLLWSRMVREYLMGARDPMIDLMAWNADTTRMPATMHSQYLRRLFLHNDLSEGRYPVGGHAVSLGSLETPTFMVGSYTDHVAPWRSVHKLHFLSPADITFVLTSGGHNAGIVNPPQTGSRRHYQLLRRPAHGAYLAPDDWLAAAPAQEGSWWPQWQAWLASHSAARSKPPRLGTARHPVLGDAPGLYVLEP